jgi:TonB family protein
VPAIEQPSLSSFVLVAALSAAIAVQAAPEPQIAWVSQPSEEDFVAALPEAARSLGLRGRAVMQCDVKANGALNGCAVIRESPAGLGLGTALLGLSAKYRRPPPTPGEPAAVIVTSDWYQVDAPPDWIVPPTYALLLDAWPKAARKRGQDGDVVLDCILTPLGDLTDCVTLEESPRGFGFGDAAIAMTPDLSLWPARYKGARTTSQVRLPFHFRRNASPEWPSGSDPP